MFDNQPTCRIPLVQINISCSPMSLSFPQCFIPLNNLVSRLHWSSRGTTILRHSEPGGNDAIDKRGEDVVVRFEIGWGCGRHDRARLGSEAPGSAFARLGRGARCDESISNGMFVVGYRVSVVFSSLKKVMKRLGLMGIGRQISRMNP